MGYHMASKAHIGQICRLVYNCITWSNSMNKDEIGSLAQTDPLIMEFGRRFFNRHRNDNQKNYVSSKMRTLATLLIALRMADPDKIKTMKDCVNPQNFDLCQEVKKWSKYDEKTGMCLNGSVPTRLCKSLKKCSDILRSEANKNEDLSKEEVEEILLNHNKFEELMDDDWQDELNAASDNSLKKLKMTKEEKLPSDYDVSKFFAEMLKKINNLTNKNSCTLQHHQQLCQTLIAFLIAFNGRRPADVTYATQTLFQLKLKKQLKTKKFRFSIRFETN